MERPKIFITQPVEDSALKRLQAVMDVQIHPDASKSILKDDLIEGVWEIFDLEEKREYVLDVQRTLLKKHGPMYPLCSEEGYVGYSSRVHGLQEGTGIIGWMGIDYWVEQG